MCDGSKMFIDPRQETSRLAVVNSLSQCRRLDGTVDPCLGRSAKTAFTLIELLVVIAVIAILASLLLTSLQGAKLQAQQTKCVSNQRQLTLAYSVYVEDFNKGFPADINNEFLAIGDWTPWIDLLKPYFGSSMNLALCPSASKMTIFASTPGFFYTVAPGSADTAWWQWTAVRVNQPGGWGLALPTRTNIASYANNTWLRDAGLIDTNNDDPRFFSKPSSVVRSSQTPVFADSVFPDVAPNPGEAPATNFYTGVNWRGEDGVAWASVSGITVARHGDRPASASPRNVSLHQTLPGRINLALYDGHVEKVPIGNLWNYYWSQNWVVVNPQSY
jgi:prepilin-type N-terminal cleavage/methylation domain-containing protein/prepilin-type processing-associated H-X9-DG protein